MEHNNQQIERLIHALDKFYGKSSHAIKRGFLVGFASGIGGVLGAALIIILLGFLVSKLGTIPFIGEILQKIDQSLPY